MLELNAGQSGATEAKPTGGGVVSVKTEKAVSGTNPATRQRATLNNFMIRNFLRGIFLKHVYLFIPDNEQSSVAGLHDEMLHLNFDRRKTAFLFEMILKRARSTVLQFKKVCCIIIKFLECCKNETNYMRYLQYNLHKLIVASFVLSVPNVSHNDGNKILNRETSYNLYSKITGLGVNEITNCCSIVRPVIMRRSRKQHEQGSRAANHMMQSNGHSPQVGTPGSVSHPGHGVLGLNSDDSRDGDMSYNQFLEMAQRNIDIHSVNYNIGTTFPLQNHQDDDALLSQTSYPYSSSSDSSSYQQPLRLPNGERYNISMLHELHNADVNKAQSRNHSHNRSERVQLSNGYVLSTEIEQFNQMGKQLVTESFQVV